jgi:hypothetical protein
MILSTLKVWSYILFLVPNGEGFYEWSLHPDEGWEPRVRNVSLEDCWLRADYLKMEHFPDQPVKIKCTLKETEEELLQFIEDFEKNDDPTF